MPHTTSMLGLAIQLALENGILVGVKGRPWVASVPDLSSRINRKATSAYPVSIQAQLKKCHPNVPSPSQLNWRLLHVKNKLLFLNVAKIFKLLITGNSSRLIWNTLPSTSSTDFPYSTLHF